MFATGCTDIWHLMVIALDRMMAIISPIRYLAWGKKISVTVVAIVCCWINGSIWAILPLTGMRNKGYCSSPMFSIAISCNYRAGHVLGLGKTATTAITHS